MKRTAAAATAALTLATALVAGCADTNTGSGGVFTTIDEDHAIDVNAPINPFNQNANYFRGYNGMQLGWQKNALTDPNQFYPGLAKSWKLSSDGAKLTVHLQPDAKWSNGKAVTATDIKVSAAVAFSQGGSAFAITPGAAGGLTDVTVVDAHTVEFDQAPDKPLNTFEGNILRMDVVPAEAWSAQLPSTIWDTIKAATAVGGNAAASTAAQNTITALGKKLVDYGPKKDISAGPFVLQRVNPSEAVLVKNKYFFAADKIAPSKVVMKNYSGNQQIWNYLIAGQLDVAPYTATPTNVVQKIYKTKGNKGLIGTTPVSATLAFNQSVKPFDNVHVRRALAYLIDRSLVTKIGEPESGTASTVTTGLIGPAAKAWLGSDELSKLNPYALDKAKAATEFQAAGLRKSGNAWVLADGKPFTVDIQVPNGFSDWVAGAKSVSSQLTDFGIASQVATSADYATYLSDLAAGKFAVGFWLAALGPSTYNAYQRLFGSANGWAAFGSGVRHSPAGKNGNWMGAAETATVPGLGTVNPGELASELSRASLDAQKEPVGKLARYANDQLPVIQLWDYVNLQFANTTRFTDFPADNSDVLRLSAGVWMQLGYVKKK
jgi:peptide/nickel transport system substrate-binding protein